MGVLRTDAVNLRSHAQLTERLEQQERELTELRARLADWQAAFDRLPRRLAEYTTVSAAPVEPLYSPADLGAGWD